MRKRDALKLHNRDEVEVRQDNYFGKAEWSYAYVLGSPEEIAGRVQIPVQSMTWGYITVDHTDVR